MEAATIEAPPSTSPMAEQILSSQTQSQPAHSAIADMASAFEKAYPNGFPLPGEERAPGEPAKEPEKEAPPVDDKPLIPEQALKPVKKEAQIAPEVEKEIAEETKGMSEKAVTKWKKIHERATAAEARAKQMEAELAKRTALPPAATDEYQKLKADYESLDEIVKKTALERHPGFKAQYDGEIDRQMKLVKAIAGDKNAKEIQKIIDGGDSEKWDEIKESLGEFKSSQLAAIVTKIQQVRIEKEEQLADWKNNHAKLEKVELAQTAKAKETQQRELVNAVSKVMADVQENVEIFRKVDGNDEWNKEIDARLNQVKEWATADLNPEERANLAARAAGAEKYRALFLAVLDRANQLQAQIAKYKGSQPNIGGSIEPTNQGSIPVDMGYVEAATRRLVDMGELRTS